MSNNKIGIIMTNNNIYELLSTSDTIILDYTKYKWSINKDNNVLTLIEVIKQENDDHSIINTFLKKIDLTYADKIFHQNNAYKLLSELCSPNILENRRDTIQKEIDESSRIVSLRNKELVEFKKYNKFIYKKSTKTTVNSLNLTNNELVVYKNKHLLYIKTVSKINEVKLLSVVTNKTDECVYDDDKIDYYKTCLINKIKK